MRVTSVGRESGCWIDASCGCADVSVGVFEADESKRTIAADGESGTFACSTFGRQKCCGCQCDLLFGPQVDASACAAATASACGIETQ